MKLGDAVRIIDEWTKYNYRSPQLEEAANAVISSTYRKHPAPVDVADNARAVLAMLDEERNVYPR